MEMNISGKETIEEVYFLLRTAVWHQEHLDTWLDLREAKVYDAAYSDGMEYANDTSHHDDRWEDEFNRGYEQGYDKGLAAGIDEGYKDGYADGSREFG